MYLFTFCIYSFCLVHHVYSSCGDGLVDFCTGDTLCTIKLMHVVCLSGLPSHPQHEVMTRQCTGCPGMISFYIKGKLEHATTFLKNLKVTGEREE